jgi:putative membrane protein (TIGR04086 family)
MQALKSCNPIISILKGVAVSYLLTVAVIACYALMLTYTSATDIHTAVISRSTTAVCALAGGFISAVSHKRCGLILGIASGLCYILTILAMTMLVAGRGIGAGTAISAIIALTGGAVGGILGIQVLHKR